MNTKKFEALTMADPALFYEIMGEPENCKPLLEALLDEKITAVTPKSGDDLLGVYATVETAAGSYDVSLQLAEMKELGERVRASQALMDSIAFEPDDLPDTCIILLCPDDPFGLGWAVHRVGWMDFSTGMNWDDGTRVLLLNRRSTDNDAPQIVLDFLRWLHACQEGKAFDTSRSPYLMQLEKSVQEYKSDPFMKRAYDGK